MGTSISNGPIGSAMSSIVAYRQAELEVVSLNAARKNEELTESSPTDAFEVPGFATHFRTMSTNASNTVTSMESSPRW